MSNEPSVFTRIINRELPADIVYENDRVIAIKSIAPHAPVHILAIPKKPYVSIGELVQAGEQELLWELFQCLESLAISMGIADSGYKIVINTGADAGQTVFHLHLHLLGGTTLQE